MSGKAVADLPGTSADAETRVLPIVLSCASTRVAKVRYVFDTLLLATGMEPRYVPAPPSSGVWLEYAPRPSQSPHATSRVFVAHCPEAWDLFDGTADARSSEDVDGLCAVLAHRVPDVNALFGIRFDLVANSFYFLCSWSERSARAAERGMSTRSLFATSVFARLDIPQDIVDRYLAALLARISARSDPLGRPAFSSLTWPEGRSFAVALSHDVDFLPVRPGDNIVQGVKSVLRHLVRQRDAGDAARAALGWVRAVLRRRDPYGCIPQIIAREKQLGVRSSFQVAVARRHSNDVNYRIEDERVRQYLRVIVDEGFDLCLHGSYRSTECEAWYVQEVEQLGRSLTRPLGSRQHFLSFDYDVLFRAQEAAGIQYDMSMGFPDRPGPRAGFSYPYFPYDLARDRPYRVLQMSLFLMDVTLRSYMGLRPEPARVVIEHCIADLRSKGGCASVVWHPIVFGGARDPGYDRLYFHLVSEIQARGGLATDARTISDHWRSRASRYASFKDVIRLSA